MQRLRLLQVALLALILATVWGTVRWMYGLKDDPTAVSDSRWIRIDARWVVEGGADPAALEVSGRTTLPPGTRLSLSVRQQGRVTTQAMLTTTGADFQHRWPAGSLPWPCPMALVMSRRSSCWSRQTAQQQLALQYQPRHRSAQVGPSGAKREGRFIRAAFAAGTGSAESCQTRRGRTAPPGAHAPGADGCSWRPTCR